MCNKNLDPENVEFAVNEQVYPQEDTSPKSKGTNEMPEKMLKDEIPAT